ncbi:MAG: hypothetical protein Q8914_09135 [Bacteroidota bacterium]|nr:hypothetical protein [Bacteroidota bacterium]
MKSIYITFLLFFGCIGILSAQDSIYVMSNGEVVFKQALSEIDSISFMNSTLKNVADEMAEDSSISLFYKAYELTGYARQMKEAAYQDDTFDPNVHPWIPMTHTVLEEYPVARQLGYTVLVVNDSVLAGYKECPACPDGVRSVSDLEKVAAYYYSQVYPDGEGVTDLTDKRNYLNRFIAYHCLNRRLSVSRFIKDFDMPNQLKQYDMFEYIETMLDNTLLEVQLDRDQTLDQSQFGLLNSMGDPAKAVRFTSRINQGGSLNGYYQELTKPVIYSKDVMTAISSKRLRLDMSSFFPELATNNMRGNNPAGVAATRGKTHAYLLPVGYLDGLTYSTDTRTTYLGACVAYEDFQGDEFNFKGKYDVSIKTLSVPAGTYEVRLGYQPSAYRGKALFYLDDVVCGDTVNLSLYATDPEIGWVMPGSDATDPYGYENDKLLRSHGYMKAPSSYYCAGHWYGYNAATARLSPYSLRKIIGTFVFDKPGKHTLRVVNVGRASSALLLMMDYLEFVPTSVIPSEGID